MESVANERREEGVKEKESGNDEVDKVDRGWFEMFVNP